MSDDGVNVGRRRFLTAATSVVGGAGAVGIAVPFVASWNPSAKAKAAGAPVKYNISKLEPGQMVTVEWRGKPVYVVRRTQESLDNLTKVDPLLRDPKSAESKQPGYVDPENRAIKPQTLVLVGLCTHLGCAPMYRPEVGAADLGGSEWMGGFFCPCHGSKYDLAGRVYKGVPAPTNLDVPPYSYEGDDVIVIGVDQEGAA
ncbi:ubiquinol-cytochrome c reductase iron-sulfur subunit [Microbulbifer bruguierae]|uniref:Ubiquinol-cytochrome c reductase iron-sulfur subunit n=1 Tax=Microbulbifer bruguierae TaxID=3029061 RepID=A0ABY8NIN5_9GAMM|nr:ubiquinol-cytochrome c reductase iron-sulfur subunit [Microbulbifer bruguierae]WGL17962.1 ubiquinol-cytochrome c reductase iron-sulfur subunit [Microbulbifer bruguierae]